MISHEELAVEMKLREQVSKIINIVRARKVDKKVNHIIEEQQFRGILQNLIMEAATGEPAKTPHPSTGINVLEDLLKKVIKIIEVDFKYLTTDVEQRNSFRAHIIHAVRNTLAPVRSNEKAGRPEEESEEEALHEGIRELIIGGLLAIAPAVGLANPAVQASAAITPPASPGAEQLIDIDIFEDALKDMSDNELLQLYTDVSEEKADGDKHGMREKIKAAIENVPVVPVRGHGIPGVAVKGKFMNEAVEVDILDVDDEEKFIDVEGDEAPEEEPADPKEEFGLAGEDETGRDAAYETFLKIENQIVDAYSKLGNENDQEVFYDYLITNLKMHFDKFEIELKTSLEEPSTPEYEKEKEELEPGGEELGGEEGTEELSL